MEVHTCASIPISPCSLKSLLLFFFLFKFPTFIELNHEKLAIVCLIFSVTSADNLLVTGE